MNKDTGIDRKTILKTALHHLDMVRQWGDMRYYHKAAEYSAKAEALIQLLEVRDCGAIGGFDEYQTHADQRLRDRAPRSGVLRMTNRRIEQQDFPTLNEALAFLGELANRTPIEVDPVFSLEPYCEPLLWNVAVEYNPTVPGDPRFPLMPEGRGL